MSEAVPWNDPTFLREVERRSGAAVSACFQCHKCSTGCPVAPEMDVMSSQIMRLIHLGARDEALASQAIWLCASCEACTTRCPQGIDIAAVMDTLRMMAVEAGVRSSCSRDSWSSKRLRSSFPARTSAMHVSQRAFSSADSNGDGTVSYVEALDHLPGLTEAVFNAVDSDGNGQISLAEAQAGSGSGCAGCSGGKSLFTPGNLKKSFSDLFLGALSLTMLLAASKVKRQ